MKPQDLYRGQAPAAMGQMGAGLMETGANIARTIQSGYQALGQGLAGGIEKAAGAVAGAYQDKRKLEAQNKADISFTKAMLPYLSPEMQTEVGARLEHIESDPSASPMDKAAFFHNWKSYMGQTLQQKNEMEKLAAGAGALESPARIDLMKAQAEQLRRKSEPAPVVPFGAHFGEPIPEQVAPPVQDALSVPVTYQGNFEQPVPDNRRKLQIGLPQGYGGSSMSLFGR